MTHKELIIRGERWLRNTLHCGVIFTELKAYTRSGEEPDIIGWVNGRSILIECKASLSDFYADRKKLSRQRPELGMGNWRFYLTPEGLLKEKQIPAGWGLYEICGRKIIHKKGIKYSNCVLGPFDSDIKSERAMLLSAVRRYQNNEFPGEG